MTEGGKPHWTNVYETKAVDGVSWFQQTPDLSLSLIKQALPDTGGAILDVGGGASVLVDSLLDEGYGDITVLDIAEPALKHSQVRLGEKAADVSWIVADATLFETDRRFDLWHDRACFHFLTDEAARERYVERLKSYLSPGGIAIIASFAKDGPLKCSGLDIVQYDADLLQRTLGDVFSLEDEKTEAHETPWGSVQNFAYFLLRRR